MKTLNHSIKWIVVVAVVAVVCVLILTVLISSRSEQRISKLIDLGHQYLEDGEYEQAIAIFEEVLRIDPNIVDVYLDEADAYRSLSDYKSAASILERGYKQTRDDRIAELIKAQEKSNIQETGIETEKENEEERADENNSPEIKYDDFYKNVSEIGSIILWGRPFKEWTYTSIKEYIEEKGVYLGGHTGTWAYSFDGGVASSAFDENLNELEWVYVSKDEKNWYFSASGEHRILTIGFVDDESSTTETTPFLGESLEEFLSQCQADGIKEQILSLKEGGSIQVPNNVGGLSVDRLRGDLIRMSVGDEKGMSVINLKKINGQWKIVSLSYYY